MVISRLAIGAGFERHGPRTARDLGIEMVYQDLALAGNMRIDENIFLGREQQRGIFIDHKANLQKAKDHLDGRPAGFEIFHSRSFATNQDEPPPPCLPMQPWSRHFFQRCP